MYPCAAPDHTHFDFMPASYRVKRVTEDWERRQSLSLRREVFCEEQHLFEHDDADEIDKIGVGALRLVAVSCVGGMPDQVVGTVRLHELPGQAGLWHGSRLAVHRDYRCLAWLGSELIHLAVSTAHAHGCTRFLAQVQLRNVKLFRRLHWRSLEEIQLHGQPHHLMQADLAHYPPCRDSELGFFTTLRQAA